MGGRKGGEPKEEREGKNPKKFIVVNIMNAKADARKEGEVQS